MDEDFSYVMVDFENFLQIFSDSDMLSYASDDSSGEVVDDVGETMSSSLSSTNTGSDGEVVGGGNEEEQEEELSSRPWMEMENDVCLQGSKPDVPMMKRELKDIVKFNVLPLFPAKLLLKFRSVSRDWDRWISSPFFAHQQSYLHRGLSGFFRESHGFITFVAFDDSSSSSSSCGGIPKPYSLHFLPEAVSLINASHGLLCCRGDGWLNENLYYVCNPFTRQYRQLPQSIYHHGRESAILVFEPSVLNFSADYEVVAAYSSVHQPVVYFEIYSSKEDTWRCSETICFEVEENVVFNQCFYMKGSVYWQTSSGSVLVFDLKTEHCGVMLLPGGAAESKKGVLAELKGELSYIQIHYSNHGALIHIYTGWDFGKMTEVKMNILCDPRTATIVERDNNCCRVLESVNGDLLIILCGDRVYGYNLREGEPVMMNRDVGNVREAKYLTYVNSFVTVEP